MFYRDFHDCSSLNKGLSRIYLGAIPGGTSASSRYRRRFVRARFSRYFIAARVILSRVAVSSPPQFLNIAQFVNLAFLRRQRFDGPLQQRLHLFPGNTGFRRLPVRYQLHPVFLQRRELKDGQQGLALLQLPAHAASDLRKPCAECARLSQLIEVAICLQQGFDQYVFSILAIAACSHKLTVDGVFMLVRKVLKIHVWNRFTAASYEPQLTPNGTSALASTFLAEFQGIFARRIAMPQMLVAPANVRPAPISMA